MSVKYIIFENGNRLYTDEFFDKDEAIEQMKALRDAFPDKVYELKAAKETFTNIDA